MPAQIDRAFVVPPLLPSLLLGLLFAGQAALGSQTEPIAAGAAPAMAEQVIGSGQLWIYEHGQEPATLELRRRLDVLDTTLEELRTQLRVEGDVADMLLEIERLRAAALGCDMRAEAAQSLHLLALLRLTLLQSEVLSEAGQPRQALQCLAHIGLSAEHIKSALLQPNLMVFPFSQSAAELERVWPQVAESYRALSAQLKYEVQRLPTLPDLAAYLSSADQEYLGQRFGWPTASLDQVVEIALLKSAPVDLQSLGRAAVPSLVWRVLARPDESISPLEAQIKRYELDPLAELCVLDTPGMLQLSSMCFERGGSAWRRRLAGVLQSEFSFSDPRLWRADPEGQHPAMAYPEMGHMLAGLFADLATREDAYGFILSVAEYDAMDASLARQIGACILASERDEALRILGRFDALPFDARSLQPLYTTALASTQPEVLLAVLARLARSAESPAILNRVDDPDPALRAEVAKYLLPREILRRSVIINNSGLQTQDALEPAQIELDPQEEQALLKLLFDPTPEVRAIAAQQLPLQRELVRENCAELLQVGDEQVYLGLLKLCASDSSPTPEILRACLALDNPSVRQALDRTWYRQVGLWAADLTLEVLKARNQPGQAPVDWEDLKQSTGIMPLDHFGRALTEQLAQIAALAFRSQDLQFCADICELLRSAGGLRHRQIYSLFEHAWDAQLFLQFVYSENGRSLTELAAAEGDSAARQMVATIAKDRSVQVTERIAALGSFSLGTATEVGALLLLLDELAHSDLDAREQLNSYAPNLSVEPAKANAVVVKCLEQPAWPNPLRLWCTTLFVPYEVGDVEAATAIEAFLLKEMPDQSPRFQALEVLVREGYGAQAAERARPWVLRSRFAVAAINVLDLCGVEPHLDLLSEALSSPQLFAGRGAVGAERVQVAVAQTLLSLGSERAEQILRRGLLNATGEGREAIEDALKRLSEVRRQERSSTSPLGSREEAAQQLVEMLRSPTPAVRVEAARGLAALEALEAIPLLIGLLEDPDGDVRAAASAGLERLNAPKY